MAFGFDTTNNAVYLSFNGAIVSAISLQSLILASNQFIHASATIDFVNATVSLSLTPSGGSPDKVFDVTSVPGLTPYQSRVSLEAKNITTTGAETYAEFDLDQHQCPVDRTSPAGHDLVQLELVRCAR